ncbi:regulatory protein RecX [Agarilytica rhodophyticola]|uniref:regulatory protein RecX n=1 Tax=Agarilytica rhodophyticola TaxID=1737490 RepID=UPI000B345AC4|nr:regulatory protein RecX [Agarilytica rhodophyticola]
MDTTLKKDVYNKAIELLSMREHSQAQLREKLQQKFNCDQSCLEPVLERLVDQGYQSDERFAIAFTRNRLAKGLGKRRVLQELMYKGITTDIAEQSFNAEAQGELASVNIIEQTWRKKFKALPQDQKEKAKQYRFLQYRGFSIDEISQLFKRIEG